MENRRLVEETSAKVSPLDGRGQWFSHFLTGTRVLMHTTHLHTHITHASKKYLETVFSVNI